MPTDIAIQEVFVNCLGVVKLRIAVPFLIMAVLSGCGIPRDSVLLFNGPPPTEVRSQDIPEDWKGRLVRLRPAGLPNETGGSDNHTHGMGHKHSANSLPTADLEGPLGIRNVTADAKHVHLVESVATSPSETRPGDNQPPSFGFDAVTLQRRLGRPVEGLIVGYIGGQLPAGWLWCDGLNGTPDLRGRYIRLDGEAGPSGSPEHQHEAPHEHRWATAENADQPGFFGDISSPVDPILEASLRVHRHSPEGETVSQGKASASPNAPPALGMRFIMAGPAARRLPDDIVIAYTGKTAPSGWRAINLVLPEDVIGRLWLATETSVVPYKLSGSPAHDHMMRSRHEFMLMPVDGSAGRDRIGQGPGVPLADHSHRVVIEEETRVAASTVLPRFVELLLIVKQ